MKDTKTNRDERGITLIALVITIIVLIILAGVSITMLSSDKGVLTRTGEAIARQQIGVAEDKCVILASEVVEQYYYDVYVNTTSGTQFSANDLNGKIAAAIVADEEIPTLGVTAAAKTNTDPAASIVLTLTYTDGSYVEATVANGKVTFGAFHLGPDAAG